MSDPHDHYYGEIAKGVLNKTPYNKFTEALNYIAWQHYTLERNSAVFNEEIPARDRIG